MAIVKVPIAGTIGKAVTLDTSATVGADIGVNLRLNGAVVTLAQLAAALGVGNTQAATFAATLWKLIGEIPDNVVQVAAMNTSGIVVRTATGKWITIPPPPPGQPGLDGEQGLQGDMGPPGVPGATGPAGPAGRPGEDGVIGDDGQPGPPGPQGPAGSGATGAQGPQGNPGVDGNDGLDGNDGPPGLLGPQGTPGVTGSQGPQGSPGNDGQDGNDGNDGPPGASGLPGVTGGQGPQGVPGNDGNDGVDGNDGPPGLTGTQGIQGIQGATGSPGNDGNDGLDGNDGPPGIQGVQGVQGTTGGQGPQGNPGWEGDTGEIGDIGPPGIQGATGPQGVQGLPGPGVYQITFGEDAGGSDDGLPKLDLGITPTWGGRHLFNSYLTAGGAERVAGSVSPITGVGADKQVDLHNPSGAAGQKHCVLRNTGGQFALSFFDDTFSGNTNAIVITLGTSTAIATLSFGSTDNPTFTFMGTGLTTFNGSVTMNAAAATTSLLTLGSNAVDARVGVAGGSGAIITGSVAHDFCIAATGNPRILFSPDSGNTTNLKLSSTGNVYNVPTGQAHTFQVAGTAVFTLSSTGDAAFNFATTTISVGSKLLLATDHGLGTGANVYCTTDMFVGSAGASTTLGLFAGGAQIAALTAGVNTYGGTPSTGHKFVIGGSEVITISGVVTTGGDVGALNTSNSPAASQNTAKWLPVKVGATQYWIPMFL